MISSALWFIAPRSSPDFQIHSTKMWTTKEIRYFILWRQNVDDISKSKSEYIKPITNNRIRWQTTQPNVISNCFAQTLAPHGNIFTYIWRLSTCFMFKAATCVLLLPCQIYLMFCIKDKLVLCSVTLKIKMFKWYDPSLWKDIWKVLCKVE